MARDRSGTRAKAFLPQHNARAAAAARSANISAGMIEAAALRLGPLVATLAALAEFIRHVPNLYELP